MVHVREFLTFYFRNNFRQKNCKSGTKNPYMLVTRFPLVLTVYRLVRYHSLNVCVFLSSLQESVRQDVLLSLNGPGMFSKNKCNYKSQEIKIIPVLSSHL